MKAKYSVPKLHKINKDYGYVFAQVEHHGGLDTLVDLRRAGTYNTWMGLFYKGQPVGSGRICKENWAKKHVHSDNMGLDRGYRRKGHGIMLYHALILCAKRLGAKRIYSSGNLNKFSRRMWATKLKRLDYLVAEVDKCAKPCKHCRRESRYYIDL